MSYRGIDFSNESDVDIAAIMQIMYLPQIAFKKYIYLRGKMRTAL